MGQDDMSSYGDKQILLVDDFATMRKIVRNELHKLGFKGILEAEDGKQALEVLAMAAVDLIITDWNMPTMDGLELLKAIRADSRIKHIPVLMLTAEAKRENVIEALKAGVTNYIVKPFTAEALKAKIEKVL